MRQPTALVRVAVVASSVLLVCGFIAYRVGAFDRFFRGQTAGENLSDGGEPPTPTFFSSTKMSVIDNAPRGTPDVFSNSGNFILRLSLKDSMTAEEQDLFFSGRFSGELTMPSSKLDVVFEPEDASKLIRGYQQLGNPSHTPGPPPHGKESPK